MEELTTDYKSNCFDVIRLIAALQVMFGHFVNHLELQNNFKIFKFLELISTYIPGKGVIIFFLISGFFSFSSLERNPGKKYFWKKFIRIYPELWLALFVNSILIYFIYGFSHSFSDMFAYFFTQATFFQFYTGEWLRNYAVGTPNGALWTISVTIQFYFVVYFLYQLTNKWNFRKWCVLFCISIVLAILSSNVYILPITLQKLIGVSLIPYLYIFLIGIISYKYLDKIIPFSKKYCLLFFIFYLILKTIYQKYLSFINLGINYDVISTCFLCLSIIGIAFKFGNIRLKYELSYEIFIWHMIICNIFVHYSKVKNINLKENGVIFFITSCLIVIVLAGISFCFEKQIINSINKRCKNEKQSY